MFYVKKDYRIKKNKDFQLIFKNGHSFANRQFIVYLYENKDIHHFRLGLSVSKKIGNAVTRNQVKRYIRQAFLELADYINPSYDYIVIARKPASDMNFHQVKSSLVHVLKIAKVLPKNFSNHSDKKSD